MSDRLARWLLAAVIALSVIVVAIDAARGNMHTNLRTLYPSSAAQDRYLEGKNWALVPPERSVLWFETYFRNYFLQHNCAPDDPNGDCSSDWFRWDQGALVYRGTANRGDSGVRVFTSFTPGVVYMPERWDGRQWVKSGRSDVSHRHNGALMRSGVAKWESTVRGWVDEPEGRGVWVQVQLVTSWKGEPSANDTHWEENFLLDPEFGLRRHSGGNKNGDFGWDVTFDEWTPLPGGQP